MFVQAIEIASKYTRAVHFLTRQYMSDTPQRSTATLFVINPDGWALTCKHVATEVLAAHQVSETYKSFVNELAPHKGTSKEKQMMRELEKKYGYSKAMLADAIGSYVNCVDKATTIDYLFHQDYDVALLKFNGFDKVLCDEFPVFAKDGSQLKQGKSLCRLGFPFAEFTNYVINKNTDCLEWVNMGVDSTPQFPIDGMVTRHIGFSQDTVFAFEMSTPGLRGQSGGPAFDADGVVWGMQYSTRHLDLNFDVKQEVIRDGAKRQISNTPFLHVGQCIHVDTLKAFMREHNVAFNEG